MKNSYYYSGLKAYICDCGQEYKATPRNYKRSKYKQCPDCKKVMNQRLLEQAQEKRKPFVAPEWRTCKSCTETKTYSDFPKGKHTCKKCHNQGRVAYYHNAISMKYLNA